MIFTLLICCFLGLGALQPSCAAPRTNENNIVETKQRSEYYSNSGYSCISFPEFFSRPETYIDFSDSFFNKNTIGDTYLINFFYNWRICYWYNVAYGNLEYSYNNSTLRPDDMVFTLSGRGTYNNVRYQDWNVTLYDSNNDTYNFSLSINTQYDSHLSSFSRNIIAVSYYGFTSASGSASAGSVFIVPNDDFSLRGYNMDAYNSGYQSGYLEGNNAGYNEGVSYGETHPNESTYNSIYQTGRQAGYSEGLTEAQDQTTLASQIFTGCVEVGLLPVNVFLQMFEYEVFGINIAGFVSALMTIAIVIIIIRMVTGGKNDK